MIRQPVLLAAVLGGIETGVLLLATYPRTKKYFAFIPAVFWIYFLPMLASSGGLIDPKSPWYARATDLLLPLSLFILLMTVDVRAILGLGAKALAMFAAGALGIGAGGVISFYLFKGAVGAGYWAGFGALSASWTGGSANMIAVKEALGTPDAVFLPMVVVDTVVPYAWMGLLVICARHQQRVDRWLGAKWSIPPALESRRGMAPGEDKGFTPAATFMILGLGAAGAAAAMLAAGIMPQVKNVISGFAWEVIIVSTLAIACSFTPARKLEARGSSRIGYFILYFVLTTIGARANISNIGNAGVLIAAGCVIVAVHAVFTLAAARLVRAPLFLAATASQANIGGVASAPMVAEIYQKGLAPVGLLLAILGNLAGTYFGLIVGQLCRLLS